MKVTVTKANDFRFREEKEISSVEELVNMIKEIWPSNRTTRSLTGGCPAAVIFDHRKDGSDMDVEVLIYDREIEGE